MFYQLLRVRHSSSSTQSWGSVLPSIFETRDQNSLGCPLLFSNRNLGCFCAYGTEILYMYTHSLCEVVDHSRSKIHETCLIFHSVWLQLQPLLIFSARFLYTCVTYSVGISTCLLCVYYRARDGWSCIPVHYYCILTYNAWNSTFPIKVKF